MEKLGIEDFKSWPTVLTAARLAVTPLMYLSAKNNPRQAWKWGFFFGITDKVDGFLAKLEDVKEGSFLHRLTGWTGEDFRSHGFKRTEGGRMLDPVSDFAFGGAILAAAYKNGIIPRNLVKAEIAQRVSKGILTLGATALGVRLEVNNTGRYGEAATSFGNGFFYVAESIEDPGFKHDFRDFAGWLASGGLALATKAEIDYIKDFKTGLQERSQ